MQHAAYVKSGAPTRCSHMRVQAPSFVHSARSLQSRSVSYKKPTSVHSKQNEPMVLFHFVPPVSRDARTHFEALEVSRNQWNKEIEHAEQAKVAQSLKRGSVTIKNLEQKMDTLDEIISDLSSSSLYAYDIKRLNQEKLDVERTLQQLSQHFAKMKLSLRNHS